MSDFLEVPISESAAVSENIVGGFYIGGTAGAALGTTVIEEDIAITVDGGSSVANIYGGSYSLRNWSGGFNQDDISITLNSGTLTGNVYAAGYQGGSSYMTTASTTVKVGSGMTFSDTNQIISGGYLFASEKSGSTVTGNRTLVFTGADSQDRSGVTFDSFDVIEVTESAANVTLGTLTNIDSLTKTGAGTLTLSGSNYTFTNTTVSAGALSIDGTLTMNNGASVTGTAGSSVTVDELSMAYGGSYTFDAVNLTIETGAVGNYDEASPSRFSVPNTTTTADSTIILKNGAMVDDRNSYYSITGSLNLSAEETSGGTIYIGGIRLSDKGKHDSSLTVGKNIHLVIVGDSAMDNTNQGTGSFALSHWPNKGTVNVSGILTSNAVISGWNGQGEINVGSDGQLNLLKGFNRNAASNWNYTQKSITINAADGARIYAAGGTHNGNLVINLAGGSTLGGINNPAEGTTPEVTFGNNMTLAGAVNIDTAIRGYNTDTLLVSDTGTAGAMAISGVLSGAGSLNVTGAGTLTLSGENTYTGGTTINAGTLVAMNGSALGTGAVSVAEDATLEFNLANGAEVSNVISGAGAVTKTGTGTLTLSGSNEYSRGTTINAGTLVATNGSALGTGTVSVAADATLQFDLASAAEVSNVISGAGAVTKTGTGTLTLNGANTYSGTTTISGGKLIAASAGALGTGAVTVSSGTLELGGDIQVAGGVTNNGQLNITGAATLASLGGSGSISFADGGNLTLNSYNGVTAGGTVDEEAADSPLFVRLLQNMGSGGAVTINAPVQICVKNSGNTPSVTATGNMTVNGSLSVNAHTAVSWNFGANTELTVTGDMRMETNQTLAVSGGDVSVGGTLYLGHNLHGGHPGHVDLSGGTLTASKIRFDGTGPNSFTMNGGELIIEPASATEAVIAKSADNYVGSINLAGGTITANSDALLTDEMGITVGKVILNIAAEKTLTIGGGLSVTQADASITQSGEGALNLRGDITIAEGADLTMSGTAGIYSTISNSGTLTLTDATLKLDEHGSYTEYGSATAKYIGVDGTEGVNGFRQTTGAQYYLVEGGTVNYEGGTFYWGENQLTGESVEFVEGEGLIITAGTHTSAEYYVNTTVDSSTHESAVYVINTADAVLTVSNTLAGERIQFSDGVTPAQGDIVLTENGTVTGLTTANNSTLYANMTGSGTIEIAAPTGSDWSTTLGASADFTGTTYLTTGKITFNGSVFGNTLRLGNGAHMQITSTDAQLAAGKTLILDSGNHEVLVNGENTFNINGTINGEGTFDKRGGSSIVNINAGAVVGNYKNSVGITNVNGGVVNYLINAGGTTNVSGGEVGNIMISGGTLNLTGNATITGEGATNDSNRFAGIYSSASGTINVGNGTDTSTVTTTRLEMGDGGADTLNIKQNATFIVTGGDVAGTGAAGEPNAYWQTGFLLGEYGGATTMNVEGTLLVKNAHIGHGDNTGYINIKDGAVVAAKGLHGSKNHASSSANGRINLTLEDGGKLILGEGGIDVSNLDSSLAAGTIGISANATIADGLTLTSATGTTFDTQKYNWDEGGTAITQGTEGGTLTISGAISGDGKLVKTGAGTLVLSGANTYAGGTTITGGTLKLEAATALSSGAITVEGATLDVNGKALAGKTVTLGTDGILSNTGGYLWANVNQLHALTLEGDAKVKSASAMGLVNTDGVTTLNLNGYTLTKFGSSNFALVGTTVEGTGTIAIEEGNLIVGHSGAASTLTADGVVVSLSGGYFKLEHAGSSATLAGLDGTGGEVNSNGTITLTGSGEYSYSGVISSSGSLIKTGTGTQTFSGASSTFASIAVNGGAITLSGENTSVTGAVSLGASSALNVTGGSATLSALNIAGAGITITQTGGELAITELNALHTSTIQVSNSASLTISGLVIDKDTHQLTQVGDASYSYSMENGNGFRADQTTYQLFTGYAWDSTGVTVDGFTISTDGANTYATGVGDNGTVFYVNTGKHTVTGTDESATATGYHVEAEASLILTRDTSTNLTAGQVLVTTTGAGNLTLSTDAIVASDAISALTGKLTVNNNAVLYSDTTGNHNTLKEKAYDLSSFTSVELDGATIRYLGDSTTLNNVTVGTNGAAIEIKDMGFDDSVFQLAGTTTLTGELNIASEGFTSEGTTGSDSWKYIVGIGKLTGGGTLAMASSTTKDAAAKVQIEDISDFYGTLQATKIKGSAVLALTNLSGPLGVESIALKGGAETQLTVNEDNSATMSAAISGAGTVTKLGAGSLTLSGAVGTADSALTMISVSAGTLEHTGVSNVTNVSISGGNLTYGGGTADAPVTHTVTSELKSENGSQNSILTIAEKTTLNVGFLNNAWGMSIVVDGTVLANEVKLASYSTETVTGGGTLNTGALTVSNWSKYTISVADLDVTGNLDIYEGSTLNLSSASSVIGGSTSIVAGNTLNFAGGEAVLGGAVTNAGIINVNGGTATMNSTVTSTGTGTINVAATEGAQLKLGEVATITANVEQASMSNVQMSSTGIASTTEGSKGSINNAQLVQLQEDATFTIQDMTLVNTTITAATTTEVKLNNVTATNTMLAGGKNYTLSGLNAETVGAPEVGTGGSNRSITYSTGLGVASGATLTLNLDVLGAVEQYGSGVYDITITLDGFGADYAFTQEDLAGLVKFDADSWLGKALTGASTSVTVDGNTISAGAAAAQSSGAPSVSYNATGGNVGSLVITITGLNVPEPASATLGLAALMMLCARRRRKA